MRIRIHADGRELSGSPEDIVRAMQELAFCPAQLSLGEYVDWAAGMLKQMDGTDLAIEGSSGKEKAEALVSGMLRLGLADEVAVH